MEKYNITNNKTFINFYKKKSIEKTTRPTIYLGLDKSDYRKSVSRYDADEVREVKYSRLTNKGAINFE